MTVFPSGFTVYARCGLTQCRPMVKSLEEAYGLIERLTEQGYVCGAPQAVYQPDNVVSAPFGTRGT